MLVLTDLQGRRWPVPETGPVVRTRGGSLLGHTGLVGVAPLVGRDRPLLTLVAAVRAAVRRRPVLPHPPTLPGPCTWRWTESSASRTETSAYPVGQLERAQAEEATMMSPDCPACLNQDGAARSGHRVPNVRRIYAGLPVLVAGVAFVVLLASCSAKAGSHGPAAGSSPPASAPGTPPALPAPVGQAPTIRIAGNHFVDSHGDEIRLLGVNFAGVEGACVDPGFQQGATDQHPGAVFDYQGPNPVVVPGQPDQPPGSFFATLAAWHVNAVRFMVNEMCWLGRPPDPRNSPPVAPIPQAHYSAARYRQAIETFVASLHRYGMIAVPVLGDNPCPRNGLHPPGSQYSPCSDNDQVMPDAANAPDFWRSFAATFKNDHSMVFELFNEPHPEAVRPDINVLGCWRNGCEIPGEGWRAAGMQQLIDAIRSTGATQPILVPGINYSAVLYHPAGQGLTSPVGWLTPGVRPVDTLSPPQLAAANHMYDNSYDNTDLGCPHGNTPDCWDNRLAIIAAQVPLVTTELGEHDCARSAQFINSYMNWADTKPTSGRDRVSYLAWTFNADYSCNDVNTTLITDWSGTPNVAGRALRAHLIKNNGR